jgi:hypothetical protein
MVTGDRRLQGGLAQAVARPGRGGQDLAHLAALDARNATAPPPFRRTVGWLP